MEFIGVALFVALAGFALSLWALFVWRRHRKWHAELSLHEQLLRNEMLRTVQILREAPDMRAELAWDNYTELCRRTDRLFHGLIERLQNYEMNEQDIRICILVFMGLSHKEIADMLNCSPKSIGKLKDITARKIGVSGGQLQNKLLEALYGGR